LSEFDSEVLKVDGLRTHFTTGDGIIKAVDGVSFSVRRGETLGVVGESGCGKSITAFSIMRLLPRTGRVVDGRIVLEGRDLAELSEEEMQDVRGNEIAMIFQEPMTSLNPVFTVGDQVGEEVMRHLHLTKKEARDRAVELFRLVGIPSPERRVASYPHELSGGLRQRVMIAMALACNPKLLIADEPTTALDVTIQAQILELMRELQERTGMAIMLITHDLGVIAEMARDVVVMYAGKVVEHANVEELFEAPLHPYTQGLMQSIPSQGSRGSRLSVIRGTVPHPLNLPPGCLFAPRCPKAFERCPTAFPARMDQGRDHDVACYLYGDDEEPGTHVAAPQVAAAAESGLLEVEAAG
jgi:oligopeptide/dipeptide ABC transporter ATP-binding protein